MSNSHPLRPLASVSEIDHIHLLSEQLGALVPGEEYSDVTFIVEEKRFPAHRVILAARCHYFRLVACSGIIQRGSRFVPICCASDFPVLDRGSCRGEGGGGAVPL